MKRFCVILLLFFSVFSLSAEDIDLLKWDTKAKEVLNHYLKNGWSVSVGEDSKFIDFKHHDKIVNYHQYAVDTVSLMFSGDDIVLQQFVLNDHFTLANGLTSILNLMTMDKAQLYDWRYSDDGIENFYYHTIVNNAKASYILVGQDDFYIIFVVYYSPLISFN